MHSHPHPAFLVLHQVHVVVTRADGAELRRRQRSQLALRFERRVPDLLEHRVIDSLACRRAHAERDPLGDLTHDLRDAAERPKIIECQIGPDCLITARDIEADPRR